MSSWNVTRGRGVRTRGGTSMPRNASVSISNRFATLDDEDYHGGSQDEGSVFESRGSGNEQEDGFTLVSRKRQRVSTGGGSIQLNDFETLSTDDKLIRLFSKVSSTEVKVDRLTGIENRLSKAEKRIHKHSDRLRLLEYKSLDLEARARRRNLLFRGINEARRENCFEQVRDVVYNVLGIHEDMYLERAHRLGRKSRRGPRPIIVAFRDYWDVETIMQEVYSLKDTPISINRDYPAEIVQARKAIWPFFKEAKQNRSNRVSIMYPARLVVNGATTHDCFPEWNDIMRRNRVAPHVTCIRHTPVPPVPKVQQDIPDANVSRSESKSESDSELFDNPEPDHSTIDNIHDSPRPHQVHTGSPVARNQQESTNGISAGRSDQSTATDKSQGSAGRRSQDITYAAAARSGSGSTD